MHSKTIVLIGVLCLAGNVGAQQCCEESRPLVTVYGTAELKVVPDVVDISVGVEIRGRDLAALIEQQTNRVTETIAVIRKAGVDAKDIQTDFANVSPIYSNSKNGRNLDYFIAKKGIAFTLKDTAKFDALMAALIQSGVDRVRSVSFRATDIRKYRDQAREIAVTAAREKAVALAAKLDQKIGKAFSIDEDEMPISSALLYQPRPGLAVTANYSGEAGGGGADSSDGSLVRGEIPVEARVKVRFELQ